MSVWNERRNSAAWLHLYSKGTEKGKKQTLLCLLLAKTRDCWLIRLYSQEHFKGPTWESKKDQTEIKLLLSPPYDGESSVTPRWKDFKTARRKGIKRRMRKVMERREASLYPASFLWWPRVGGVWVLTLSSWRAHSSHIINTYCSFNSSKSALNNAILVKKTINKRQEQKFHLVKTFASHVVQWNTWPVPLTANWTPSANSWHQKGNWFY